jgi:hypothetical protein
MRKLTVKVINSTQTNRIGVNETLAVIKNNDEHHQIVLPSQKPKRKHRSNQPPK